MKIVKIILIGIASIIGIFLLLGLIMPKKYHVERSISINAPQSLIMAQTKSLKNMQEWSPWAEYDPNMKVTYTGTDGETGSISSWEGNKDVGKGQQEIMKITDNRVDTKISFKEPWESVSYAYVECTPEESNSIKVTWGFDGEMSYPWNALSIFNNMDKMLGKDFEKGLNKLKTRCETMETGKKTYRGYEIHEMEMPAKIYIGKKGEVAFDKISEFYRQHLSAIYAAIGKAGVQMAGAPSGIYFKWDEQNKTAQMAAAIPVAGDAKTQVAAYDHIDAPAGKALYIDYYGAYDKVGEAHYAMDEYMKEKGLQLNEIVIEEYVTDPSSQPDTSQWLTKIYYPVK